MCDSKTCPGDPDAKDKWSCRACYGVTYKDPDTRKADWIEEKKTEKITAACGAISRAVQEIEGVMRGRVDREMLYGALTVNGDTLPGHKLRLILDRGKITTGDLL